MKDIEFTVFIEHNERIDTGDKFLIRLVGVTEDYGFLPDYMIEESKAEIKQLTHQRFVIPIMLFPGYNPRFEGNAIYELDSYMPSTQGGVRGIVTYRFTGTAG